MKTSKRILIVIFAINIFLIVDKIRVSANEWKELETIDVNSENLNNLNVDKEDIIFQEKVNELGKHLEFYKNNIQAFSKEVLGNIDNKEEAVGEEFGESKEIINDRSLDNDKNNSQKVLLTENNNVALNKNKLSDNTKDLEKSKWSSRLIFNVFILSGIFFTILISYVKFRKL